jgi:hypothetical protein
VSTHVFPIILVLPIIAAVVSGAVYYCLAAGIRNGDHPCDAKVTAALTTGSQPDETRPVIMVTVRNPSGSPVLVALRARRAVLPTVLAEPHAVSVPRLTSRGKFRPDTYETVGVAPAGGSAELTVPVTERARRYLLTAAVGQDGARLRVHRLRLGPVARVAGGRDGRFSSILLP